MNEYLKKNTYKKVFYAIYFSLVTEGVNNKLRLCATTKTFFVVNKISIKIVGKNCVVH